MKQKTAESDKLQDQTQQYREALQDAYSFVEGEKNNQTFSALTPEDCYDQFIERIEGKDTPARPNVLNRIAKVKNDLIAAVAKIKALPPEVFRDPDPQKDVNTSA